MKDTSNCIEAENERIEKLNKEPSFWIRISLDERKVYAYRNSFKNLKKITYQQALHEHKNGTAFTKQALDKLEGK